MKKDNYAFDLEELCGPTVAIDSHRAGETFLADVAAVLHHTHHLSHLDVALGLAACGVLVVVTVPSSKEPLLSAKHINTCTVCEAAGLRPMLNHGATTDPALLAMYFDVHPDAGVGMKNHPRLVRGDGDFADAAELKKAYKAIGYGQPFGERMPCEAATPGGQYRRRVIHSLPDGVTPPGGGTRACGIAWYGDSGYTVVKGGHPNGGTYGPFYGEITPLPEKVALQFQYRATNTTAATVVDDTEATAFLNQHVGTAHLDRLADRRHDVATAAIGERHHAAVAALTIAFRDSIAGHYPAKLAQDTIHEALRIAGWEQTRFDNEWNDIVRWAIAQVQNLTPAEAQAAIDKGRDERIAAALEDAYPQAERDWDASFVPRDFTDAELDALEAQFGPGAREGDEPEPSSVLTFLDWATAFNRPPVEAVVDGLIFPGRWTATVGPPKVGKSDLDLHVAHCLARGVDPFTGNRQLPIDVAYFDGEMGEPDVLERLAALGLTPADLPRLHYTDIFPKGDTLPGGTVFVSTAKALGVRVVILDGLNAFVSGAEKDDLPWRNLFEQTIAPLKRAGIAVLSSDNTGKDLALSARGSSAKLDKADAIIMLKRTDNGVNLRTTHQRTATYARTLDLAMVGPDGSQPISYRHVEGSWPAGTNEAVALLHRLGIPIDAGRDWARATLQSAGHKLRNDVLSAAIRYRKTCPGQVARNGSGQSAGTGIAI